MGYASGRRFRAAGAVGVIMSTGELGYAGNCNG